METYQHLRQLWTSELERAGELARLSRNERRLLDRGSLDLLAETRLRRIGRRRRWLGRLPFARPELERRESLYRRLARCRRELTHALME